MLELRGLVVATVLPFEAGGAVDWAYPLVSAIYDRPTRMDMHTRIKAALRHLGVSARPDPRPPLLPRDAAVDAEVAATATRAEIEVQRR
jgi:dihydrodipicolinate synthase/N-acetylneuraminate lyase